jgi:uncharacterized integral membrane protein (TIGR00698 family)
VSAENLQSLRPSVAMAATLAPGIILSALVAAIGYIAAPFVAKAVPIPNMVIALVVGIALNPLAARPAVQPGMNFCVKTLLRWAVALLGLRVGLGDIAALGLETALLIVIAMAATVVSGLVFARWYGRSAGFGALVGVGTAVCGASATLATSTVVPEYKGKAADIAFVVVAVNALATLAMLVYPPLCIVLGFDPQTTGVMLGGTIHDVAQVVGAGYAVSEPVGNTAVIVKLFRVFLLLCILNSAMPLAPSWMPVYTPMKSVLVEISTWGLLLAIGALGLGTSVKTIIGLGWRHITTVLGTTAVIFVVVTGGLMAMRFM